MQIGFGTRVVVTGASRGIGRVVATELADRGCDVGLVARSADELEELAAALPGDGHQALAADVGDADQVAGAIAAFEPLDVLVANAGVADYGPFRDMEIATVERMTRVNWLGTVYAVSAALPGMLDRARGHIVVVSSGAGLRSFPWAAVYGATKAAQRGFAEALRHELSGTGVSLTTVYPGEVESNLHDHAASLPDWNLRNKQDPPPAGPLAEAIVRAVENDERAVYYPAEVRTLRVLHGLSPKLADRALRLMRGATAAPRVD
jgi:3-hydroxybutyrate dehydrogenase